MNVFARYAESLKNFPTPGGGGAHTYALGVANLGIIADLSADQVFRDIRRAIPSGKRKVPDSEITDAINKALADHKGGTFTPKARPTQLVRDSLTALQRIISQGKICDEADLWERSPLRLWDEPKDDLMLLLEILYRPDDLLTIRPSIGAGIIGETIRSVSDWTSYFRNGGKTVEHIIPNPMTGQEGMTKNKKPSFQCDETVKTYRFCVIEFDDLFRKDQLKFWSAIKLPIVALIDSGGKSIHGWIDVQKLAKVESPIDWTLHVKGHLYDQILTPMGIDSSCSNPSRLSRLPGHFRIEKQAYQRLLWLSPEGRPVCP